jgi:hypothetical protein
MGKRVARMRPKDDLSFADASFVVAEPEHNWLAQSGRGGPFGNVFARQCAERWA